MILSVAAPLSGLAPGTANLVVLGVAAVAVLLAYASTRAGGTLPAFGAALLAMGAAGAAGWLAMDDVASAAVAGGAALLLVAAANLFVYPRPGEVWGWGLLALAAVLAVNIYASLDVAAFLAFAAMILFGSLKVVTVDEVVHATVYLALVLFGVSGLFLALGMPFLAMIQVLVYVGAVITLILFTVMLTIPRKEDVSLDNLELPPGVTIESVEDLDPETPRYGHGPMKGFTETNPRKPVAPPATLYGTSLADDVYGTETTVRRKAQKEQGGR